MYGAQRRRKHLVFHLNATSVTPAAGQRRHVLALSLPTAMSASSDVCVARML